MAAQHTSRPVMAQGRALLALAAVVALPSLAAGWLNGWSVFAFPMGTLLVGICVPFALIGLAIIWDHGARDDPLDEGEAE